MGAKMHEPQGTQVFPYQTDRQGDIRTKWSSAKLLNVTYYLKFCANFPFQTLGPGKAPTNEKWHLAIPLAKTFQ